MLLRANPTKSTKPEIYVSTYTECDGPIPGPYSMLSLDSVAYTEAGERIGSFRPICERWTAPAATRKPEQRDVATA